MTESSFSGELY